MATLVDSMTALNKVEAGKKRRTPAEEAACVREDPAIRRERSSRRHQPYSAPCLELSLQLRMRPLLRRASAKASLLRQRLPNSAQVEDKPFNGTLARDRIDFLT